PARRLAAVELRQPVPVRGGGGEQPVQQAPDYALVTGAHEPEQRDRRVVRPDRAGVVRARAEPLGGVGQRAQPVLAGQRRPGEPARHSYLLGGAEQTGAEQVPAVRGGAVRPPATCRPRAPPPGRGRPRRAARTRTGTVRPGCPPTPATVLRRAGRTRRAGPRRPGPPGTRTPAPRRARAAARRSARRRAGCRRGSPSSPGWSGQPRWVRIR